MLFIHYPLSLSETLRGKGQRSRVAGLSEISQLFARLQVSASFIAILLKLTAESLVQQRLLQLVQREERALVEGFEASSIALQFVHTVALMVLSKGGSSHENRIRLPEWYCRLDGAKAIGNAIRNMERTLLEVPTLMIWGERDTALGKELTFDTDTLVRDFTLRYVPDVSHWVQQEAPQTVNAMIEAWLSGRPVPQAGRGGKLISESVA